MSLADRLESLIQRIKADTVRPTPWSYRIERGTRFQSYPDGRYISNADANYGASDIVATESAGTGTAPLIEWENVGLRIDAGETLVKMAIYSRINDATNTPDVELTFFYVTPDSISRFAAGWDNDNEVDNTVLYKDLWMNPVNTGDYPPQPTHTGNSNDYRQRIYPINFTAPQDGWLIIIADPVRALNSVGNDYFYAKTNYYFNPPAS